MVFKESKPKRSHAIEPLGVRGVWKVVKGSGQVICLELSASYISIHWVKKASNCSLIVHLKTFFCISIKSLHSYFFLGGLAFPEFQKSSGWVLICIFKTLRRRSSLGKTFKNKVNDLNLRVYPDSVTPHLSLLVGLSIKEK